MPRIIACVASRVQSGRLPNKVLRPLNGHPMNEWLIKRLINRSQKIDDICICTPDDEKNKILRDTAKDWNVHSTAGNAKDILKNFITSTESLKGDHLLRVTGDNIFTDPLYIDVMIEAHLKNKADYTRTENLPLGITSEVMSLDMAKKLHTMLKDSPEKTQYMMLYSFDPINFKCCVVEPKPKHKRPYYSCTIDTNEDWDHTQNIIDSFPEEKWGPDLTQIINWMDENPDKRKNLDRKSLIKLPYDETITYEKFLQSLDAKKNKSIVVKFDEYEL